MVFIDLIRRSEVREVVFVIFINIGNRVWERYFLFVYNRLRSRR